MAVTVKNIIPAKQAENTQTTQYTATNCQTIIDKFTVTNTSGGNVTFSVNIVTPAGSASDSNIYLDTRTIAQNETYTCPEIVGHVMGVNYFISTLAGSAASLTIAASGREIT